MTDQSPTNPAQPGTPGAAMPESSISKVLQRGGEELLLEKVDDRFTINATDKGAIANLVGPLQAAVSAERGPAHLTEIVVDPAQRDAVMQQVRDHDTVNYASHIYQLKDSPGSLVYLTNQITVQFVPSVTPEAIAQITAAVGLQ